MPRLAPALTLLASSFLSAAANAQSIPVTFTLDSSTSEVQIGLATPGSADSDTAPVSGTLEAVLDISTFGGVPAITGIEFTGGMVRNDQPFEFSLSVLGFLTADLVGRDFVGVPSTPLPPGPVSADPQAPLTFQYDAADHLLSFNQGVLEVSGVFDEALDLSEDPVSGMPPVGSLAMIALTQGETTGDLTEFTATLTQPLNFLDTFEIDAGLVTLPVTLNVGGQAIASSNFALDLGITGIADRGDYNANGTVEQGDLDLVLLNWGVNAEDAASVPTEWQNDAPSGIIDQDELDGVLLNWGSTVAAASATRSAVPEPAAAVLLGIGLAAWLTLHRWSTATVGRTLDFRGDRVSALRPMPESPPAELRSLHP